jgi:hypothetical protein
LTYLQIFLIKSGVYYSAWKGFVVCRPECKEPIVESDLEIEAWQKRSPVERRSDQDKRKKKSKNHFASSVERRTGKERRDTEERRDRWMRVGKWRSESVFDE